MQDPGTAQNLADAPPVARKPKVARPQRTSWNKYATRLIKIEMVRRELTAKDLVRLLEAVDPKCGLTPESLTTRNSRGTFTFSFALQVFRALKMDTLDISQLPTKGIVPKKA